MFVDEDTRRFLRIKFKVSDDISNLKELSKLIEEAITGECSALASKVESEKLNKPQNEKDYLDGWYENEFSQLQEEFPRLQRYALFTTAMATVETNIVALCHVLKQIMNLDVEYKKPRANIVGEAIKYLKEHAKVNMARFSYEIDNMDMFRRIRNCIVHSEGENTDANPEEVQRYCDGISTLSIDKYNRIMLAEGFVTIALYSIQTFFDRVLENSKKAFEAQQQPAADAQTAARC